MKVYIFFGQNGNDASRPSYLATLEAATEGNFPMNDDKNFAFLSFSHDLSDFIKSACCNNSKIDFTLSCLKVNNNIPGDSRIEAVRHLTRMELAVLKGFSEGYNYEEVGKLYNISFETVKSHASNIFMKLNVHSRHVASILYKEYMFRYPHTELKAHLVPRKFNRVASLNKFNENA